MAKASNTLVIKDFQQGIAESPYLGFSQMQNVDIFTKPGALKIARKLAPNGNSESIVTGLIQWMVQDPVAGNIYAVDTQGKLYKKDTGDNWSVILGYGGAGVNGSGLAIWQGYLFYAREGDLDVMNLTTNVWTNNWITWGQISNFHPMLSSSQRFVLYVGHDYAVDSIEQNAGTTFDPTNPATYTQNLNDLELGSNYRVQCLEEVGGNIAIGTRLGDIVGGSYLNNVANTFFWDGVSDFIYGSQTTYFAENGVWQMKNVNNALYTVAGTGKTRLFAASTAQAQEVKRLNNLEVAPGNQLTPHQDAIDLFDGEILFGVGGASGDYPFGVYSYRNNAYILKHLISTGEDGQNGTLTIGSVKVYTPDSYLVSYFDNNTGAYGVDYLTNNYYIGYTAQAQSPIYAVATDDDPKTFEKCQIRLGKPMRATDNVRVYARFDLDSSYVLISEFLGASYVDKTVIDKKVSDLGYFKNIQIMVQLDTGASETVSPELMEVTLQ